MQIAPSVGFLVDTKQARAASHAGASLERTVGSLLARRAITSLNYAREPGLGSVLIAFAMGNGSPDSGILLTPTPSHHAGKGIAAQLGLALARLAAHNDMPPTAVAETALALRIAHAMPHAPEPTTTLRNTPVGARSRAMGASAGLSPSQIDRTTRYIEEHIHLPLTTAELAAACRLCETHFVRAFRATLGTSPWQWVIRCRIQRAQALLAETTLCLSDIASACGFVAQSHFNRTFTKVVGVPPGSWRRRYRVG